MTLTTVGRDNRSLTIYGDAELTFVDRSGWTALFNALHSLHCSAAAVDSGNSVAGNCHTIEVAGGSDDSCNFLGCEVESLNRHIAEVILVERVLAIHNSRAVVEDAHTVTG